MGLTKSEMFTKQQNEIALFAKVFGHPALQELLFYNIYSKSTLVFVGIW